MGKHESGEDLTSEGALINRRDWPPGALQKAESVFKQPWFQEQWIFDHATRQVADDTVLVVCRHKMTGEKVTLDEVLRRRKGDELKEKIEADARNAKNAEEDEAVRQQNAAVQRKIDAQWGAVESVMEVNASRHAKIAKVKFDAFIKAGFTPDQALQLCK